MTCPAQKLIDDITQQAIELHDEVEAMSTKQKAQLIVELTSKSKYTVKSRFKIQMLAESILRGAE